MEERLMNTYAGIDLHSTNSYIVIIDDDEKVLFSKRVPNDPNTIFKIFLITSLFLLFYYFFLLAPEFYGRLGEQPRGGGTIVPPQPSLIFYLILLI